MTTSTLLTRPFYMLHRLWFLVSILFGDVFCQNYQHTAHHKHQSKKHGTFFSHSQHQHSGHNHKPDKSMHGKERCLKPFLDGHMQAQASPQDKGNRDGAVTFIDSGVKMLQFDGACLSRRSKLETVIASPMVGSSTDIAINKQEIFKGKKLVLQNKEKVIRVEPLVQNLTFKDATWNDHAVFLFAVPVANVYWDAYFQPNNLYHNIEVLDGELKNSIANAVATVHARLAEQSNQEVPLDLVTTEDKVGNAFSTLFESLLKSGMFGLSSIEYFDRIDSLTWRCYPSLFVVQSANHHANIDMMIPSKPVKVVKIAPPDVRQEWLKRLKMADNYKLGQKTTIVINLRKKNRRILNIDEVKVALLARNWSVKVVEFESMSIDEQFLAVQDATTYIGSHGAGLRWGQFIHKQAAIMQLVGFPCSIELQSKMGVRPRYAVIRSLHESIKTKADAERAERWCKIATEHQIGLKSASPLREEDAALLSEWKVDVRLYDVNADVDMLVRAVEMLDPVQAPNFTDRKPNYRWGVGFYSPIKIPIT